MPVMKQRLQETRRGIRTATVIMPKDATNTKMALEELLREAEPQDLLTQANDLRKIWKRIGAEGVETKNNREPK